VDSNSVPPGIKMVYTGEIQEMEMGEAGGYLATESLQLYLLLLCQCGN